MTKYNIVNLFIVLVLLLGIAIIYRSRQPESFVSSSFSLSNRGSRFSGKYPDSITKPLLHDVFQLKTSLGFSTNNSTRWKLYPSWAIGSYEQKTNNIKTVETPCNGTDLRAGTCGGFYKSRTVKSPCIHHPPKRNCRRINYYCS